MSYDPTISDTETYDAATFYEGGWDRTLLNISSFLTGPACWAYGLLRYRLVQTLDPNKFDNYPSKMKEITFRLLIASGAIGALYFLSGALLARISYVSAYGLATKVVRAAGYFFQKNGVTHIRGKRAEEPIDKLSMATWNIGGIAGGMPKDHCGVNDWDLRIEGIVEEIIYRIDHHKLGVAVLEEIYDTAIGEAIIQRLETRGYGFAHYFTHLGKNVLGSESGVMVLTNHPIHSFSFHSFENNNWTINRGFVSLELKRNSSDRDPAYRILGTHLIHNSREKRKAQVQQMLTFLAGKSLSALPTFLLGDLNIERDGNEGKEVLTPYFTHSYLYSRPTSTNELVKQWRKDPLHENDEMIDYISQVKENHALGLKVKDSVRFEEVHLGDVFAQMDTRKALSDHQPLVAIASGR